MNSSKHRQVNPFISLSKANDSIKNKSHGLSIEKINSSMKIHSIPIFHNDSKFVLLDDLQAFRDSTPKLLLTKTGSKISDYLDDAPTKYNIEWCDLEKFEKIKNDIDTIKSPGFAGSASYMGSKRLLAPFLIYVISKFIRKNGSILDMMCGSGAASGIFSRYWKTISSDSQEFCKLLSFVQGGGGTDKKTEQLLSSILPIARKHSKILHTKLSYFLKEEDEILHSDLNKHLYKKYGQFLDTFPLYPTGNTCENWDPVNEIKKRKNNPGLKPYCLFTTYFANVYFGLRQCVEIDSLRYAIDTITNNEQKKWALGSLIASVSALGSTYAGHFAQPKKITTGNFSQMLHIRSRSIFHEFTIRLNNLSHESFKIKNKVTLQKGPFSNVLKNLDRIFSSSNNVVYVDAPYKREDYSRYYHVLETLVKYTYPDSTGKGRMPNISTNERFRSEFSSRNISQINQTFVHLFNSILKKNQICVWSYSDSGNADMIDIIKNVYSEIPCSIRSFGIPYSHQSQGRRKPKKVLEYLVVFVPN